MIEIEIGEYVWDLIDYNVRKVIISISDGLRIKDGLKVVVCGLVGLGKLSLFYSIFGEILRMLGKEMKVFGKKVYVL